MFGVLEMFLSFYILKSQFSLANHYQELAYASSDF